MNLFYGGDAPKTPSGNFCWVRTKFVRESGPWYAPAIKGPFGVVELLNEHLDLENADREMFIVLYLDMKRNVSYAQVNSVGGLHSALVHPREVFRTALLTNCNSVILVHNHPSGNPAPSKEDISLTDVLIDAGEVLGIEVLDHIVVGYQSYVSFHQEGLLKSRQGKG